MRWIAILSAFALAACSTVAENSETQESINQKIAKGKTTKAEVKATFGEPSSTTRACIQLGGVCQGTEQNQTRNTVL